MKLTIWILGLMVAAISGLLFGQISSNRQLQIEIETMSAALKSTAAREGLELQQRCAARSEQVFLKLGYKLEGPTRNISATYQSHYNPKLNKCFMTLETTSLNPPFLNSRYLFDAFEQRGYAEYMWMSKEGKKYWEVPPFSCNLTPTSRSELPCASDLEYRAFVATYMEE